MKAFKRDNLYVDGSLRDIIIKNASQEDWNNMINIIKECYYCELTIDNQQYINEYSYQDILNYKRKNFVLLKILVGNSQYNCHFFSDEYIEIDIDPKEVCNDEEIIELISFMRIISYSLNKNVYLTTENCNDNYLYKADYEIDESTKRTVRKDILIRKNKLSKNVNYGDLFNDCLNSFECKQLTYFESESINNIIAGLQEKSNLDLSVYDKSELVYIIWDNVKLPIVSTKLENVTNNMDEIMAVSFHTWIFLYRQRQLVKIK